MLGLSLIVGQCAVVTAEKDVGVGEYSLELFAGHCPVHSFSGINFVAGLSFCSVFTDFPCYHLNVINLIFILI